ncbi:helix-turn-helix domain-containing protein [Alcanivorax sp. JB21]|uniref:helix-turn-helix domain-containing protein n=1 Tax=Alcanivorax limicola TaxID=2874102 RepID=UPI001CBBA9E9|nr:helix-turn-helix domain-containing protein [Alcanivorax limicola]MBZ2190380.1 helix-turn-helix domain-containing protein [Alcanivorax limicola]
MSNNHHSTASLGLPFDSLDTASLPAEEGHALWRDSLSPLFHARAADEPRGRFNARIDTYDLQQLMLAESRFPASHYERGLRHSTADGAEPLLVQLYMTGGYRGTNGHRQMLVQPGDIGLLDMADAMATRADDSRVLSLVIPREQVREAGALPRGAVLRAGSPLASILGNHLQTVWRQLALTGPEALSCINETLIATTVAAFRGLHQDLEQVLPNLPEQARLNAVCAYILQRLGQDDLTPEHLCQRFGFSRAGLYRLFAPLGGVAGFIREARLRRCYDELAHAGAQDLPSRVIDVAMRWGFTSQSHFTRLFRRRFDVLPGELLANREAAPSVAARTDEGADNAHPVLRQWLGRMCRDSVATEGLRQTGQQSETDGQAPHAGGPQNGACS